MSFFRIFTQVLVMMVLVTRCSQPPIQGTVSLLDQVTDVDVPWQVTIYEDDIVKLINRKKTKSLKQRGGKAYQIGHESTIRLPITVGEDAVVVMRIVYRDKWTIPGYLEVRLVDNGEVVGKITRALQTKVMNIELRNRYHDVTSIHLIHKVKPGVEIPLQRIVAGELEPVASSRDKDQLTLILTWLSRNAFDTRQELPASRRFPISLAGCTRNCLFLSGGDTLEIETANRIGENTLRFWMARLCGTPRKSSLRLEARTARNWTPIEQWKIVDNHGWRKIEVKPGHVPPGANAIRLLVVGPSVLVAIAEPVLLPLTKTNTKHNLILIDLDTVRADRLGCYGYDARPTSAALDSIIEAKGFALFTRAYAPSPWTLSSTAKFFASRYLHDELRNNQSTISTNNTMLAEIMRDNGYYCVAFTGGVVLRTPGFQRGFHEYYWSKDLGKVEDSFPQASRWLQVGAEPFFLFLHTYEAHEPFTRSTFSDSLPAGRFQQQVGKTRLLPPGLAKTTALSREESLYVEALYDGGVKAGCDAVVELFAQLDRLDLWDKTMVIVLSDHGEEMWDHFGIFARHGHSLYEELLDVPFMIRIPDRPADSRLHRVNEAVSLVDLVPTVVDMLDLDWVGEADGLSLAPLINGEAFTRDRPILASLSNGAPWGGVCLFSGDYKYIEISRKETGERSGSFSNLAYPPGRELYDLDLDSTEEDNLIEIESGVADTMRRALRDALRQAQDPIVSGTEERDASLGTDLTRQLQALGYLD